MKEFYTVPAAILLIEVGEKELKVVGCNELGIIVQSAYELELEKNPIVFKYFCVKEYGYKSIAVKQYRIIETSKNEFYFEYKIQILDEKYRNIYILLQEQLKIIDKYEGDKNYDFHKNYNAAVKEWFENALSYEDCKDVMANVQNCFVIDNMDDYQMFLDSTIENFLHTKFERLGLDKTFCAADFSRAYIGNQYCHNLFPNKEKLLKLMDKANDNKLDITIAFTYIRENLITKVEEQVQLIDEWALKNKRKVEIIVNDWGMLKFLSGKEERLVPVLGVLLNKRKKDPRIERKIGVDRYASYLEENNLNTEHFQEFLKNKYIDRIEYESHIIPNKYAPLKASLHFPYYQTNTSQYCPLYAQCVHLNRDQQELIMACPKYCRNFVMMFPKDVKGIGKYNSIFGVDDVILKDKEVFHSIKDTNVDRLVLNI